jgi:ectoine hydroxylase
MDKLSAKDFDDSGYAVIEDAFTSDEIRGLRSAVTELLSLDRPERVLESNGSQVRSVYNVHNLHSMFGRLVRDRRLVQLAMDACEGEPVYIHQTQCNPKAALHGDVWQWHQDYVTWARDDGMPAPRAVNVALLLDNMTEFNGPLFVIPGSHHAMLDADTRIESDDREGNLAAKQRHQVSEEAIRQLAFANGMVSLKASAGSLMLFHSNILHSSPPNLSPWPRWVVFLRYNPVSNALGLVESPRAEWIASRNPSPVSMVDGPLV